MTSKIIPKPTRGQCGTCSWFEVWPGDPDPGTVLQGSCVVRPPIPVMQLQQRPHGPLLDPTKPAAVQMQKSIEGMVPPTNELRRCSEWRPMGTQPPFDDHIRPGLSKQLEGIFDEVKQ